MKKLLHTAIVAAVALALLVPSGCKIVSGTYVVEETFYDLTPNGTGDYYYEALDITDNSVWQDHKDDIKDIDNIGFEIWLNSSAASANNFNCYVDALASSLGGASSKSAVIAGATHVLVDVPMPAGKSFIGYAASFSHITNLSTLKTLGETGQFKFWAMADVTTSSFTVDSIKVVVTLTAGT
ncbi:MAG: hypothetical protein OEV49_08360 [candidate division Zixibacteria bacterium]|nr:hypothetical protein [candidate division Zixibacteria bacterium]MDH3937388.1 hypothetical protein [candidate division Zixibacteria bacterium]MDH4033335.1 hypothetical protein [candidate division Zixibacteria bacterium]